MEGKTNIIEKYSLLFLVIIFSVGVAGHLFPPAKDLMLFLTPATLLITNGIVVFNLIREKEKNLLLWMVLVYSATFTAEVIGVKTGVLFGSYEYGETLGLKILEVPVIIGLNWVLVILGAILLSQKIFKNDYLFFLLTGFLAFAFDFILEPSAISLNYWRWEDGTIPIQNYISWFTLSLAAAVLFKKMNVKVEQNLPFSYLLIQSAFFLSLLFFMN